MTNNNMTEMEYDLMNRLEQMLAHSPELAQAFHAAEGYDAQSSSGEARNTAGPLQPDFADAPVCDCVAPLGQLITQTLDNWGLYPQEELFRLIWQQRDKDAELTFMRGNAAKGKPLTLWHAETRHFQGECALYCYDEDRRNCLYMILCGDGCSLTRREFFQEMREFLNFSEKLVWMCDLTAKTVLEVIK